MLQRSSIHAFLPSTVHDRPTDKIAQTTYAAFRSRAAFGSLDGLRAVSILAVVWQHAGRPGNAWQVLNAGFLGVDLFFVISGFLIVTLLLRERSLTGEISLQKFYVRRLAAAPGLS